MGIKCDLEVGAVQLLLVSCAAMEFPVCSEDIDEDIDLRSQFVTSSRKEYGGGIELAKHESVIPVERIQKSILLIRNQRVIVDADLAVLYGVSTKRLNEQVKRNRDRFPEDFMFRLTPAEKAEVVANCDHLSRLKFSPMLPNAFTEHGTIMAANVLNSPPAIRASVYVVRAFVRLREMLATHQELARQLAELERKVGGHEASIRSIIATIRHLMQLPERPQRRQIGFHTADEEKQE